MAINLWKLGGKPTSYNPLPIGWGNTVNLPLGTYQVRVKAKSASNATLTVTTQTLGVFKDIPLTNSTVEYVVEKTYIKAEGFFLYDKDSKGDIIITDIQLVQKPLSTLTINGIDGFQSGKWSVLTSGGLPTTDGSTLRFVDDRTVILDSVTATWKQTILTIPVKPSTSYVISGNFTSKNGNNFSLRIDGTSPFVNGGYSTSQFKSGLSVVTNSNAYSITIFLQTDKIDTITVSDMMLNLGTIPAPYEKKRGERMVMPVVKGNMLNNLILEQGNIDSNTGADIVASNRVRTMPNSKIPVKSSTIYNFSLNGSTILVEKVMYFDQSGTVISRTNFNTNSGAFTTPSNCYSIRICFMKPNGSDTILVGDVTSVNPQLNEGATAQPYKPYAVQVNKKPLRYVPKKNLFDKNTVTKAFALNVNGTAPSPNGSFSYSDYIRIKPSTFYVKSNLNGAEFYDANKGFITGLGSGSTTFTSPSNAYYFRVNVALVDLDTMQLEEGSTATPYEPYQLVLPKTKAGLSFNGVTDYLQLPSMTMDSIELDINVSSDNPSNAFLIDARNGFASGFVSGTEGSGWNLFADGVPITNKVVFIPRNKRIKLLLSASAFTDDVTLFNNQANNVPKLINTLYKVTCYLGTQVVASYDFTNPSSIVGNTVLQNAKNLIPSFEDARWSLHANAQVLGKDVLRLNASTANQSSYIYIPVNAGVSYKIIHGGLINNGHSGNNFYDANLNPITSEMYDLSIPNGGIAPSGSAYLRVRLYSNSAGTFDFYRPQLYQFDGKQGTLNGTPTAGVKQARRTLYAKR